MLYLKVNENDLRNVNHEEAVSTLRMAKNPVKLTVYRENIERLFTNPNGRFLQMVCLLKTSYIRLKLFSLTYGLR